MQLLTVVEEDGGGDAEHHHHAHLHMLFRIVRPAPVALPARARCCWRSFLVRISHRGERWRRGCLCRPVPASRWPCTSSRPP